VSATIDVSGSTLTATVTRLRQVRSHTPTRS
jgi:hypothetical protein